MPTSRPRHMVTETPEIAAALDGAARRWPQVQSRGALLAMLAVEGGRLLSEGVGEALSRRRTLIAAHAGEFAEVYGAGAGR